MPEMIIRGGTWGYLRNHLPAFRRSWVEDDCRSYVVGFRVACEVATPMVIRAGAWSLDPFYATATYRHEWEPGCRCKMIGFRVACEVEGNISDEDFQRLRVEASEFNKELLQRLACEAEGRDE